MKAIVKVQTPWGGLSAGVPLVYDAHQRHAVQQAIGPDTLKAMDCTMDTREAKKGYFHAEWDSVLGVWLIGDKAPDQRW